MVQSLFSKNILFLRKKKGWTQSEMYDRCGFNQTRWSSWENNGAEPDISNLIVISNLFGITIDDLVKVDLAENVHLTENLQKKNSAENVHLNVHPNVHLNDNNDVNEPELHYNTLLKNEVDLLILQHLNSLSSDMRQLKDKLL